MTKDESLDIALGVTTVLRSHFSENRAETTANMAVQFIKDLLRQYPKVAEDVDRCFDSFETDAQDFNQKWEQKIEWIKFEKTIKT